MTRRSFREQSDAEATRSAFKSLNRNGGMAVDGETYLDLRGRWMPLVRRDHRRIRSGSFTMVRGPAYKRKPYETKQLRAEKSEILLKEHRSFA
jgi:hypothetical protein